MRFVVIHRPTCKGGWTWPDLKTSTSYSCSCGLQRRNAFFAMSKHDFSGNWSGNWRSQFYTILIISAGIYNEDAVRYFSMPGNIFLKNKNIQQGTVQLGIGQPHVGSYIPSRIVETSNLPITIKRGFCNALSSGHGEVVWWCHGGHCFCSGFQAKIPGK